MKIVQAEQPKQVEREIIQPVEQYQKINFNDIDQPKKQETIVAVEQPRKSIFSEPQPLFTPMPIQKKKKSFGTKAWWIFKGPVLLYLLALSYPIFIFGSALATKTTNPSYLYAILGLHAIIIIMFALLCVMTKAKRE